MIRNVGASEPRRKCFAPRSAKGCLVCRQRRLKCDEKMPACNRCVQGNWQCQYRGREPHASVHHATSGPAAPANSLLWHAESSLSSTERQALHHYTSVVASGLFEFVISDFWTYSVAQRCYATPTVRSAVLALSATHLDFSIDPHCIDTVETKVARGIGSLQLYNTAIAALRVYIEQNDKPSRADVLFSCAALVCCDLMRGDCGQATKHVDHGSTLVRAWQQEVVCRPAGHRRDDELEEIGEVFRAFDLHATTFDDSRLPLLAVSRKNGGVGSTLPVEFANLQQAQRYLVQIQSSALVDLIQSAPHKSKQMFEVPRHVIVRRRATRASFQKWSSALACLETNVTRLSKMRSRKEEAALCVFKIHHRILQLLLEESFHEIDLRKPFDGAGDQLLLWAEQALKLRPAERCFSVDVGLGPSLFLLVLKTTQISLRQRGTRLLACLQKLEGWHKPQAMLRAVNDLTIWESYEEAQLHDNGAKMALEQVAEQAGKYGSGVERSSWLDASFVDNADAASTAAL